LALITILPVPDTATLLAFVQAASWANVTVPRLTLILPLDELTALVSSRVPGESNVKETSPTNLNRQYEELLALLFTIDSVAPLPSIREYAFTEALAFNVPTVWLVPFKSRMEPCLVRSCAPDMVRVQELLTTLSTRISIVPPSPRVPECFSEFPATSKTAVGVPFSLPCTTNPLLPPLWIIGLLRI
jgi:hypothetical protein